MFNCPYAISTSTPQCQFVEDTSLTMKLLTKRTHAFNIQHSTDIHIDRQSRKLRVNEHSRADMF